ncbi:MAG: hypothetical protein AABY86_11850, partial [Bdellovibrionota bacterium]
MRRLWLITLIFMLGVGPLLIYAQDVDLENLDLLDEKDSEVLKSGDIKSQAEQGDLNQSELEEKDDLESLKGDVGDVLFKDEPDAEFKGAGKDGSVDGTKVDVSKVLNEPNLNEG